jgi:hypothetical protein
MKFRGPQTPSNRPQKAGGVSCCSLESISLPEQLNGLFLRFALLLTLWVPLRAAAGDPASLKIRIVEGDGAAYALGSRSTRGIAVEVTDDTGKPVEEATVSFRLPEDGPGGAFSNQSKTQIATTGRDGRASVWGMQWNRMPGAFEVRITVAKGDARAGTVCSQTLTTVSEPSARRVGGSHKWIWIALGVAGGAAAAVILVRHFESGSSLSAPSSTVTYVGSPTIAIGPQQPQQ